MKNTFYKKFIFHSFSKKLIKHINILMYYTNYIGMNKVILKNCIPYIQFVLNKVYNKKVELNIVSLRYIHLNTDTLMQAMAVKLKNRKSKITKVLRRSLDLIYLKPLYKRRLIIKNQLNLINKTASYLEQLAINRGINFNHNENRNTFGNLFASLFSNVRSEDININSTNNFYTGLKNIKYKWVTGVCLSANGRLTRRYTASRAVHKIRYKGSLQNFDFLQLNLLGSNSNASLLRARFKSNVHKSFIADNRRIGVFGIKGWISGY